jgi:hypothetical protein
VGLLVGFVCASFLVDFIRVSFLIGFTGVSLVVPIRATAGNLCLDGIAAAVPLLSIVHKQIRISWMARLGLARMGTVC